MTVPPLAATRITDLVEAYLASDYQWELGGYWRLLQLGARADDVESAFPDASSAGLLSAWNPHSIERAESENREADGQLADALAASGLPHRPAFSSARNRSWREPSWMVMGMPVAQFDGLARRFGQLGTLYAHRGTPMRLRIYGQRPAGCAAHALVDWV